MQKYNYLNLGCGSWHHSGWVNLDFVSTGPGVIAHNLLQGIPFENEKFEVVYHSHVLEHFSKSDGEALIRECYRVLKPGGVIRIAIPDLERIVKEYLRQLENAMQGQAGAADRYDWMMLEMYDQTVRNFSGGEMAKHLFREHLPEENFIFERIGIEGKDIRKSYLQSVQNKTAHSPQNSKPGLISKIFSTRAWKGLLQKKIFPNEGKYVQIGRFRLGGEIHQWMYDRYSLKRLLENSNFSRVEVKTAKESNIENWEGFQLDIIQGEVRKPDSLYVEAFK
jgi:predicted SAM-dependent methyltransferase